jgi:hypothetical protein
MHRIRTALVKWFLAIYLAARDKRGISAMALAKEIDVTYKTAWLMLHKIRKAMRDRNARYMLSGIVEIDDAFLGVPPGVVNVVVEQKNLKLYVLYPLIKKAALSI